MIEFVTSKAYGARIKVIGVGGGGCNAVNNMITGGLKNVELIAINTDSQALSYSQAQYTMQIGQKTTSGEGAGSIPAIGRASAEENIEQIKEILQSTDMVFITCGMGGGTGTGASPVVAKAAKDMGILVVAIVTTPFEWEGEERAQNAKEGIEELRSHIDALIVIPNEKLLTATDTHIKFSEAYKKVDSVLFNATKGISEIITTHGYVNVDFADVRTVMKGQGDALMGIGIATGENRALEATENALNSPLLDGISINGAKSALVNICCGNDLELREVDEVLRRIKEYSGNKVNIIHGIVIKENPGEEFMVTVVATGFDKSNEKQTKKTNGVNFAVIDKNEDLFKNTNVTNGKPSPFLNIDKENTHPTQHTNMPILNPPINVPRGNQVSDYDGPAINRRKIKYGVSDTKPSQFSSVAEATSSRYEHENKIEEERMSSKDEHNKIAIDQMAISKPAFLRRLMD